MARPREFDAEVALESAMELLWTKGYEATSLDDLCEVTGLSRSSFYATFGSKRKLLLRSVDRYVERRVPKLIEMLARPLPVHDAFAALLGDFIDQIVAGAGRRGCFLGNCAAELPRSDRGALTQVRQGLGRTAAQSRCGCAGPVSDRRDSGAPAGRQGQSRPLRPRGHRGDDAEMSQVDGRSHRPPGTASRRSSP
jgi:AcrR family transcriptional regulator